MGSKPNRKGRDTAEWQVAVVSPDYRVVKAKKLVNL